MQAYAFNDTQFAFEAFAEEIVVLNLADGTYFAFGGSAVTIWPALTGSVPTGAIAHWFSNSSSSKVEHEINDFAAMLVKEGILVSNEPTRDDAADPALPRDGEFVPISLEKHTDMEDLLTLDPIHDVDPQKGWPSY